MKKFFLNFFISCIVTLSGVEASNSQNWIASPVTKRFIENKSQFDGKDKLADSQILYGIDNNGTQVYFTKNGLTYRFDERENKKGREEEREREKKITTAKEWAEHEKEERSVKILTDVIHMQWGNSNPDVQVIAEEKTDDYFSYAKTNGENINYIKAYKKIIYKNLYPNIDVEYIFHDASDALTMSGIKYSLVLHPGADVSKVKMVYSHPSLRAERSNLTADKDGNIHISTLFGDIIDHAPKTFYADNHKNISSAYLLKNNTVSFSLPGGEGKGGAPIIIDPWSQTPTLSNSNGVWECERDGAGNVYIIGGDMPMKLLKYTAAGTLVWTYPTPWDTANNWLGTLATDLTGNSYITSGSIAAMQKISPAGAMLLNYTAPAASTDEYWTISFNCDQTKLIVGGTSGAGFPSTNLYGCIYDINTTNLAVLAKKNVGAMFNTFPSPYINEVRTMTSSRNGRYYYLTLDSMGCIDQNFSACSVGGAPIFQLSSGYTLAYKCENFRPNNGNAGIKSIRANANFVYTQNGTNIQKRSLANGSVLGTAAIPGGISTASFGRNSVGNSGIDIDTCGNVYVGSANAIIKYDANLNLLSNVALPFGVSDIAVSTAGNVIVCGTTGTSASTSRTGYVQSIASFSACNPLTLVCCDATVCNAGPFCAGAAPVNLSSSTSGGTWSGTGITNSSTGTFSPVVSGTGTFVITYSLACGKDSMTIVVNNCTAPVACVDASGNFVASGGSGPTYTWYQWSTGGSTPITNQAQCTACNPSYTWFFGQCLNGAMPVTTCTTAASWQQFSTSTTVTPPGTYPIMLQDATGNTYTITSSSSLPPCSGTLNVTTAQVNPKCNGQCNGTATATPSSGTSPYTYAWSPSGGNSSTATGLCAATYTVLVTDASGLTKTATVTITQPTAIAATASVTSSSCGGNNGSATASASGGTGTLSYSWNTTPAQTTPTATGLTAGNYSCTVTDANGCTKTAAVIVTTTPGINVSATYVNLLCNGGNNGSASATPSGGTSPYTYSWNNGQSTANATGLSVGTYTVLITDAAGCNGTQTVSITQLAAITSSVSVTNTTCGASTGDATVTASGGTGNLTYSWSTSPVQNTPSISNLAVGNYSCTITDANGCTQVQTALISNANGPTATIASQVNVTCTGGNNGSANSSATGGTSPYTFLWNTTPPQSSQNATGLSAGTYTITVTDASGCSNLQTVTITQPAVMTAIVSSTPASCGQSDGTATANPSGGTGAYSYMWSSGFQNTQTATGLVAGNYSVIVTDASGCSNTFTATVANSNGPTATAGTATTIISGSSANLTASGGVSYSWSNGATGSAISVQPAITTEYCVYVSDASGCTDSACVIITVEAPCGNTYYLPNAFSPISDDLVNRVFKIMPDAIIRCIKEYKFAVYDRWGEKVFESEIPSEAWDGYRKGRMMDTQVLAYYLHIIFTDGTTVDRQGNVSLIR